MLPGCQRNGGGGVPESRRRTARPTTLGKPVAMVHRPHNRSPRVAPLLQPRVSRGALNPIPHTAPTHNSIVVARALRYTPPKAAGHSGRTGCVLGQSGGALRANGLCARPKRRGTQGEWVVCSPKAAGHSGRTGCVLGQSGGAPRANGLCARPKRRATQGERVVCSFGRIGGGGAAGDGFPRPRE